MTDSRQRVEVPNTKHFEGLVQKGVPPATRTGLFSTPKFSFCDGQPVYLLRQTGLHIFQYAARSNIVRQLQDEK